MHTASAVRNALLLTAVLLSAASPAAAQSADSVTRLQSLVNDAAAQFQLSCRHDPAERQRRFDELSRAVAAWKQSAHSEADDAALVAWLRDAMRRSMPGSHEALSATPKFQHSAPVAEVEKPPTAAPPTATRSTTAPSTAPPIATTRDKPAAPQPDRPATATSAADDESTRSFWIEQAGAAGLPNDLLEGDPFRDDPPPDER